MSDTRPMELVLNRRTVLGNIIVLFSGSAISQGLTALTLLLIARGVGPAQYGEYASAVAFATILSILFGLGLDIWLLREGGSRPAEIGALAGSVLAIKVTLGAVWLAALFVLANFVPSDSFTAPVLRMAALILLLDSLLATLQATFKSALLNQITSTLVVSSDLAWFLASLVYYLRGGSDIGVYMQIRVLVLAFSVLAGGFVFYRRYTPRIHLPTLRRIRQDFAPYFISDLLLLALLRVDVVIVSLALGKEMAGYYSPAVSLIYASYLIPTAIHGVMLPVLSNLFARNPPRAWRMAYRLILIQAVTGLALALGVYFFSPLLVGLLGEAYQNSLEILKILSFNLFFHGISFAMVAILVANNLQARRTVVQLVAVVINVGLDLAVVYWAGIQGVAVMYVVAEIVLAGGYTLLVYQYKRNSRLSYA
jgi:O-antigen/teichoic acid export membrane protein